MIADTASYINVKINTMVTNPAVRLDLDGLESGNPIIALLTLIKWNVSSDIFPSHAFDFVNYKNVYLFERYKCIGDVSKLDDTNHH